MGAGNGDENVHGKLPRDGKNTPAIYLKSCRHNSSISAVDAMGVATKNLIKATNMATAWADYCISKVRYNSANTHIDRLIYRIHDPVKNVMGGENEMSRANAVKLLEQGKTFVSITENDKGGFKKGAPVSVFPVSVKFLKTAADNRESDNLDHLPRF